MADIFFVLKMILFTLVLVVLLQVKVGETTLEEKVIGLTHQSELAGYLQETAKGAAHFVGVSYNRVSSKINSNFIKQHSPTQIPGQRLKAKIQEIKNDLNQTWEDHNKQSQSAEELN